MTDPWHAAACILCSENCGIEVKTQNGAITQVRGDKANPDSQGYLCQKAARLNFYQNHADRLDTPLRRRRDGSYEPVTWERAIREIADRLTLIRDTHGGRSIAYYGGGGQGNHLGGVYGASLRSALGTPYVYTALAQEKTGDFWVNGELFGRQTCHVTSSVADADYVLFLGTNPWQSHGFPRARQELKALSKDPARTMVVLDPRRTETADLADVHLAVRPGGDAFALTAMLAVIVQEGRVDAAFLAEHTHGYDAVESVFQSVDVDAYATRAGLSPDAVREVARGFASAERATVRADLGLQQSANSTLNSYLEKLLFLLTGNFGKRGGNNLHTYLLPLIGHSNDPADDPDVPLTQVTGMRPIGKLYPPNILPEEINTDHPGRLRALVVDSANPLVSAADTGAYERAMERLELSVCIDVAFTETARRCDFVLPASSQFEKGEATFFTLGFPHNGFHYRRPLFPPLPGTLSEPEIYHRLVVAMGALPPRFAGLEAAARLHRRFPQSRALPLALAAALKARPAWVGMVPAVLYATLGKALPDGTASAAVLWGAALRYAEKHPEAVKRAGVKDRGAGLGEALFETILESRSGMVLSEHTFDDTWSLMRTSDRRVRLAIPSMLEALSQLAASPAEPDAAYPLSLMAGERRSYNANTIYRDPEWRRNDQHGAVRVHPDDAATYGVEEGQRVRLRSSRGEVDAVVSLDDTMLPGVLSIPHGYGMSYMGPDGERRESGPRINRLTASDHCDPLTKTPFHKGVPVALVV
ncbi:MAG: molybdopterin-dependent oxidoreductase [Sandaracinaceae bacterium]